MKKRGPKGAKGSAEVAWLVRTPREQDKRLRAGARALGMTKTSFVRAAIDEKLERLERERRGEAGTQVG